MPENPTSKVLSMLQGLQYKDSRTYEAMNILVSAFSELWEYNFPTVAVAGTIIPGGGSAQNVTNFQYIIYPNNLRLSWDGLGSGILYQIRLGIDWDTASLITTTGSLVANIDPISVPLTIGTHRFLIKAIDADGQYSDIATYVDVLIPSIIPPIVSAKLITNFVLLTWTNPGSVLEVDRYDLLRNGTVIGTVVKGNFHSFFEVVGGNNAYQVVPYDIVGNMGDPSTAIQLLVSNPTDFILEDSITSTFSGTISNGYVDGIKLIVPIFDTETWEDHFINNSWTTIQDQIDAGYPIYIQPSETTAQYEEIFDFGIAYSNLIINIDWNFAAISGNVTIATTIEYSTDGITWSTPVSGTSVFADIMQYARVTVTFTPDDSTCILAFYNFRCLINVHRENDGGYGTADASDPSGTPVTFNKVFLDIDSINVTAIGSTTINTAYDYSFTPGDQTFYVYLFDSAGSRVSGDFTWAARGVI